MPLSFMSKLIMPSLFIATCSLMAEDPNPQTEQGRVITFGEMHQVIGQQQHQGRVRLKELVQRDHFYGVGALEGLQGEITINNGTIVISSVSEAGKLKPVKVVKNDHQAALLVGGYVPTWHEIPIAEDVSTNGFDEFMQQAALRTGIDHAQPLVFTVEGEFHDVRLHVINGACPVHARIHNSKIPLEKHPNEREFKSIRGTIIGVYAEDAVGKLTHPSTSTHCHLVYEDPNTGEKLTGHLEQVGIVKKATLKLPK